MATNQTISVVRANKNKLIFHGVMTVPGILVAATNVLIIFVIYKHNKLHQKTWFLLASLAIADCFVGLSFGLKFALEMAMYHVAGGPYRVVTAMECLGKAAVNALTVRTTGSLTLAIAIDRVLAVTVPIKYKVKLHNGYVVLVSFLAWADGLVHALLVTLVNNNFDHLFYGNCTLGNPIPLPFQVVHQTKTITTNVLVILLYISIIVILKGKIYRAKKRGQHSAAMDNMLQTKVSRTIGVVLMTFIVTTLARSLSIIIVRLTMPHVALSDTNTYTSALTLVNSGANIFIFTAMASEFRGGLLKVIKGKPTTNVIQLPQRNNNGH